MWKCPECGRSFQRTEQDHYCAEPPKTIDAYILQQPEEFHSRLFQVREVLRNALPEASEKISWHMPTYWNRRNLIHFACFKKHLGIYPGPEAIEAFAEQLKDYHTSKGAIQFPHNRKLPLTLIEEIARWCQDHAGA